MRRDEWLDERKSGIGASEAAIVLGLSPWKSPLALYAEKIGVPEPTEETEAMEWGRRLERPIAEKFAETTGRLVELNDDLTIDRHPEFPFILATLDATQYSEDRDGPGVLEIKTTNAARKREWIESGPPQFYLVQVQHQLCVTGRRWGSIAVLFGGQEFAWFDVERNDAFIDEVLVPELRSFWERIEKRIPPPADGSDSSRKALEALYPVRHVEDPVVLPGHLIDLDLELTEINAQIKELQARKRAIENAIIEALQGADSGVLANGVKYTYREQTRKSYVVPETTFRVLRRHERKKE